MQGATQRGVEDRAAITAVPARGFSVESACEYAAVRQATASIRAFLQGEALPPAELDAWELALTEAGNNAVAHVTPGCTLPIRFDVLRRPEGIEVRIIDHTEGFDLPAAAQLPPPEAEHGRGLFFIQSLADKVSYLRGTGENCLFLSKRWPDRRAGAAATAGAPLAPVHPADDPRDRRLRQAAEELQAMTEELATAYESLSAIFRFTADLGQAKEVREFAGRWLRELLAVVDADWYVLRLNLPESPEWRLFASWGVPPDRLDASSPPSPLSAQSIERRAVEERQDRWLDAAEPLVADDPLAPLQRDGVGIVHPLAVGENLAGPAQTPLGVLSVGRHRPAPFTAGQANVIQTIGDFLGIHIANVRLQEASLRTQLLSRELEIAAEIQQSLLPERLPEPAGWSLAGCCQAARQVGGDFYDVLEVGENSLLLAIADVMGKSVPAAMIAAVFRSQLRGRPDLADRPGVFLETLNRLLMGDLTRVEMFITAQLAFVDFARREVRVASAGHLPLLIAGRASMSMATWSEGVPLGIRSDSEYSEVAIQLPSRACLLMFTDGVSEAYNEKGNQFGISTLEAWLARVARSGWPADAAKTELLRRLRAFGGDAPATDDQTFILLAERCSSPTS